MNLHSYFFHIRYINFIKGKDEINQVKINKNEISSKCYNLIN